MIVVSIIVSSVIGIQMVSSVKQLMFSGLRILVKKIIVVEMGEVVIVIWEVIIVIDSG